MSSYLDEYLDFYGCPAIVLPESHLSWDEDNYKFVQFVEKIYPTISHEHIIYDPYEDKQVGLYAGDFEVKTHLPELMYQKTTGNIHYKSLI